MGVHYGLTAVRVAAPKHFKDYILRDLETARSLKNSEVYVCFYLSLQVSDWSGHDQVLTQGLALPNKLVMSPSFTAHGSQYDTKYVSI